MLHTHEPHLRGGGGGGGGVRDEQIRKIDFFSHFLEV